MSKVEIEPMRACHLSEILRIEEEVFPAPWTRQMFEMEIRRGFGREELGSYALVGTLSGDVIAYAIAWFLEDEVHLVNIAVDKAHQEHGIGSFLLNHLIDKACDSGKIIVTLEVRESNKIAQAFYQRFMFQTVGIRRGYYTDNREDAVLMVLDLGPHIERRKLDAKKTQSS
ncbi:MAG: ribosomal protein S18-alanine N-acetyltransferase [Candidatus Latescibacterota bacterium]|nr:MAG: ribosomal protein S18-alanine N-acetyltransferase [Candidatus Latescibacterota bacterium]